MIDYQTFKMENGLTVIVHSDHSVKTTVLNVLYNVGSKDEDPEHTGFAHLFEHLMFGGSVNVPSYDLQLQEVGAQNNAFTSPDLTNYYVITPSNNIETAMWVESDRMLGLNFDPKVLEVQRKVVIEEFKQRYINQPYGDVWHKLRETVYSTHPYQWPTIGKNLAHIEEATMEMVKDFFYTHYLPNNAFLVLAGDISHEEAKDLTYKWFSEIPAGKRQERNLPKEPEQTNKRSKTTYGKVPLEAIYRAYPMPNRLDQRFTAVDLTSDALGRDEASLLYCKLVVEQEIFSSINAYITGSVEEGLFMISGRLNKGITAETGEAHLDQALEEIKQEGISEAKTNRVKNQALSSLKFEDIQLFNRGFKLAYFAMLGNIDLYNKQESVIQEVSKEDVNRELHDILREERSTTLLYKAEK